MHELAHEFTNRKVSPWGGLKFFHSTYTTSGIRDYIKSLNLPEPGSNRGYNAIDLIEGFIASIIVGSRRLEHSGMLRTDAVIKEIFGWKKGMASASTFSRFFRKFTKEQNRNIFPSLMKFILSKVPIQYMTIDIDGTVITRYGHQEGAAIGYNPKRRGKPSHYPIMAFCDELKMVVNAWMRKGNSDDRTQAIEFLTELFEIVEPRRIGLLRGDVGYYGDAVMRFLEQQSDGKGVNYIFRARMTPRLVGQIIQNPNWHSNDSVAMGANYSEINYKTEKWKYPRRIIVVRTPKTDHHSTRTKELFKEFEQLNEYDFTAFVTNTTLSAVEVHRRYNQRGESENRIKELKYDYGMDGFALRSFEAMEAAFRFVMVAFNIMTIFKQAIMQTSKNHRLNTIKFQCIAIGSYLVHSGRKIKMKLAAEGKRRHFLEHLFQNMEVIRSPYRFPNA